MRGHVLGEHMPVIDEAVGDVVREGKPAVERDADIVAESRLYVAAPYSLEPHPKSGVWANIKRAEAAGVPTIILAP
jgi:hypothetical protein